MLLSWSVSPNKLDLSFTFEDPSFPFRSFGEMNVNEEEEQVTQLVTVRQEKEEEQGWEKLN